MNVITYYEILNWLLYKDARKQPDRFEKFIGLNRVIPLTLLEGKIAASIYAELRKRGTEIGHTDTLIAGISISNGMRLVTNNTEHFKRIKELTIENWKK